MTPHLYLVLIYLVLIYFVLIYLVLIYLVLTYFVLITLTTFFMNSFLFSIKAGNKKGCAGVPFSAIDFCTKYTGIFFLSAHPCRLALPVQ